MLAGGVGGVTFGTLQEALVQQIGHLGGGGGARDGVVHCEPLQPGVGGGLREARLVLL